MSDHAGRQRSARVIPCPSCDHEVDASDPWPSNHACPRCDRQLTRGTLHSRVRPAFVGRWLQRRDATRVSEREILLRGVRSSLAFVGCSWLFGIVVMVGLIGLVELVSRLL